MKNFSSFATRPAITSGLVIAASFLYAPLHAGTSWHGKLPEPEFILNADPDKTDAMYHKGDTVTFTIELKDNHQPAKDGTVDYVISKDGVTPPINKGTATLVDGKATVTAKLDEPGFLCCDATYVRDKDTYTAASAAAIDPTDLKPSMPKPDDFDAFWDAKKKELAAIRRAHGRPPLRP